VGHQRLQRVPVAAQIENLLVLGPVHRVVPVEDVCGLAQRQPEIGPLERDVGKPDHRPSGELLGDEPLGIGLNPRQRHPRLHAALRLDEFELHVHGRCELRLCEPQLFQLDDFP
jgi:hypothetical protein